MSTLIGPLIAAVLLAVGSPATVFAAAAAAAFASAMLVRRLEYEAPPQQAKVGRPAVVAHVKEGFRALAVHRDLALPIWTAQQLERLPFTAVRLAEHVICGAHADPARVVRSGCAFARRTSPRRAPKGATHELLTHGRHP